MNKKIYKNEIEENSDDNENDTSTDDPQARKLSLSKIGSNVSQNAKHLIPA